MESRVNPENIMNSSLYSCIYVGEVKHRRYSPAIHKFSTKLFMPFIDLDEIKTLSQSVRWFGTGRFQLARFRKEDYFRGHDSETSLKDAAVEKLFELVGETVNGRVMVLCQLRYAGVYFSPINIYYFYDEDDNWQYCVGEVSNTPWNERHYYAIPAAEAQRNDWGHNKEFHVSPFKPNESELPLDFKGASGALLCSYCFTPRRRITKIF